jgi:N utilization substance protein B
VDNDTFFSCIGDSTHLNYDDVSSRAARSLIFHILYVAEVCNYDLSIQALVDNLNQGFGLEIPLDSKVVAIAKEIIDERDALDEQIKPFLKHWRFDRLSVCTKLILRFAIWEITHTDTVINIIANESIELAKCFSEKDAYKFINGIVDGAAKKLREVQ